MSEHDEFLSTIVAVTAQIGVIEQGGGAAVLGRRIVELTGAQGDALAIEPDRCGIPVRDAAGWRARR
jgi:hypothetical protein